MRGEGFYAAEKGVGNLGLDLDLVLDLGLRIWWLVIGRKGGRVYRCGVG